METFGETLGLRDPTRERLEPNLEEPNLESDVDRLLPDAMRHFVVRSPKMVVLGDYGTSKTHLLTVLKSQLPSTRFHGVYVKLEPYGRVAESRQLHRQIVRALEVAKLLPACIRGARRAADLDVDVRLAFDKLQVNPNDPEARAWLLTEGPTATQARKAGFSGRLYDLTHGVGYVAIWRALGRGLQGQEASLASSTSLRSASKHHN